MIRMKVPWDDGNIRLSAGEECCELPNGTEARLVNAGLAEFIPGPEALDRLRAKVGMEPLGAVRYD